MSRFVGWTILAVCLAAGPAFAEETPPVSCWPGEPGTDPGLCPPNDPRFDEHWEFSSGIPGTIDRERMHPAELELGAIGFSLDTAWQLTTGRDDVLIAVLDSGIEWDFEDLTRKLYLNAGELPRPEGSSDHDANDDGIFNIDDYANDSRVSDRNENGRLDPGDLIRVFSDCRDDDGNGYPDDISGYDFFAGSHCGNGPGDNDPSDQTRFGHGTGIASNAAAETNNGIRDTGVCPRCRILPVRIGDSFVVDANRFARGTAFAVTAGASVIASATGSFNNTPAARFAIDYAYENGVAVIGSAADEFSYHHNYPSVYNHAVYVNSIRFNHSDDYRKASTFWGINPCTNFGARVWVTVPATSCSSGATSRLAGISGLIHSAARDGGHGPLQAEELYQLLRVTADDLDNRQPDWGSARYPARPGFDQFYGYGRVHAERAVRAARDGVIPPMADLSGPVWFSIISPTRTPVLPIHGTIRFPRTRQAKFRLEYALGVEPVEDDYHTVSRGDLDEDREGLLGVLNFRRLPVPRGPSPVGRDDRDRYSVTVRLTVTDDLGRIAEARRSFFVYDDPAWKAHFPVALGASGEAGPVLHDLDGDGDDEIILPTADGRLRIFDWKRSGLTHRTARLDRIPPVSPTADPHPRYETAVRGAVVGDIHGKGQPSIVHASYDGKVYAFTANGERRQGWPVVIDEIPPDAASEQQRIERGILSRPVLGDLDGKPGAEVVVGGLDGKLYAWTGDGRPLPGFPVRLTNPKTSDPVLAKLVSTPSIGDIDGDGTPEIVVGSNLMRDDLSAAFAVRASGNLHPDGALVPGWPLELAALRASLLPTIAIGVQMDPQLADLDEDGDMEVVLYAVTSNELVVVDQTGEGPRIVSRLETVPASGSGLQGTTFIAGTGSPLLADADGNGSPEVYAPLLPFRMLTLRMKPGIPLDATLALGGWSLAGNTDGTERIGMLEDYPRRMEDLMIFARPSAADLDGDGRSEILMGSGGYLLHAFRGGETGEPAGFPKFTGGWIFSAPATGDLDGDGVPEVVTVTREGYLFAWEVRLPEIDPSAVSSITK